MRFPKGEQLASTGELANLMTRVLVLLFLFFLLTIFIFLQLFLILFLMLCFTTPDFNWVKTYSPICQRHWFIFVFYVLLYFSSHRFHYMGTRPISTGHQKVGMWMLVVVSWSCSVCPPTLWGDIISLSIFSLPFSCLILSYLGTTFSYILLL